MDKAEMTMGAFIAAIVLAFGALCYLSISKHSRLMAQCMADGKQEYECYAMLKTDTVAVPVVVGR